jgi:hypothetical protein
MAAESSSTPTVAFGRAARADVSQSKEEGDDDAGSRSAAMDSGGIDHRAGEAATVTMDELVARNGLAMDMIKMTSPRSKYRS